MAGVGYQLSDRAVLDFGYRYIDLGKATSERSDTAFFVNPRVVIRDMDAHEFKVGLRYHFGGGDCCDYGPMK
jgi:opacity protein-like surface antigen